MAQHLTFITGASRGLGLAMGRHLLSQDHFVVGIARTHIDRPSPNGGEWLDWSMDLSEPMTAARRLEHWLASSKAARWDSVSLIHNAGVLSRVAPLSEVTGEDLTQALRVGLEAPLLLTSAFLRATAGWTVPRKVLMISSGLGRRAMAGSASYCAAKAGLDHLARAVALEEAGKPYGARVASLAPGVIDTDMQAQLRQADPAGFPDHARFVGLKSAGELDTPDQAALKVLDFLARSDFGSEVIADVRST